jgi:hypothetical protein
MRFEPRMSKFENNVLFLEKSMSHFVELYGMLASLKKLASAMRNEEQIPPADFLDATEGLLRTYFFPDKGSHLEMALEVVSA